MNKDGSHQAQSHTRRLGSCGAGATKLEVPSRDGQSARCVCSYGFRCHGSACSVPLGRSSAFAIESFDPERCTDCACVENSAVARGIPNTLFSTWSSKLVARGSTGDAGESEAVSYRVEGPTSEDECAAGLNLIRTAELNRDMSFKMLDDDDCIAVCSEVFPALVPYYRAEPRGQYRGDVCRGCALLRDGGFYVDADVEAFTRIRDAVPSNTHLVLPWGGLESKRDTCMWFNSTILDQYSSHHSCNGEVSQHTRQFSRPLELTDSLSSFTQKHADTHTHTHARVHIALSTSLQRHR